MMNEYQQSERHSGYQQECPPNMHLNRPMYSQQEIFTTPLPHQDVRVVAALTYSLGWFSGLLFTLFARDSRYVRFHALQSLLFFGGINLLDIALMFFGFHAHHFIPFLGVVAVLGFLLINVIAFVGWLVAMVQAYKGSYYRMPVVGDSVARTFQIDTTVK